MCYSTITNAWRVLWLTVWGIPQHVYQSYHTKCLFLTLIIFHLFISFLLISSYQSLCISAYWKFGNTQFSSYSTVKYRKCCGFCQNYALRTFQSIYKPSNLLFWAYASKYVIYILKPIFVSNTYQLILHSNLSVPNYFNSCHLIETNDESFKFIIQVIYSFLIKILNSYSIISRSFFLIA